MPNAVASSTVVYESELISVPGVSLPVMEGHRVILRETVQSHSSKGINAMTTVHDIDLPAVLADRLTSASPLMCCANCSPCSSTP